jgi:3-phenylpropionate/cinnamic acid dioxygenase small subunit
MGDELIREVEQFLYREARLLDERRLHEWLALFTDDVRYWMVTRSNLYPRSSKAIAILNPERNVDETADKDGLAVLDETKKTLEGRVARAWPGRKTRRPAPAT